MIKPQGNLTASQLITNQITDLADWRGDLLAKIRKLVHEAAPDSTEEWKWGTAVWSQKGDVLAAGAFKDHVKINFFKGASLVDAHSLFNSGLDAKKMRSIDFFMGDNIKEPELKDLIRAAVAHNLSGSKEK
jgi:hypothetical protein